MRGVEIEVSLPYFLSSCGLEAGSIKLANVYRRLRLSEPNMFVVVLYGDDERLPEVEDEEPFPKAQIVMTENPYTCKVTGRIVVSK